MYNIIVCYANKISVSDRDRIGLTSIGIGSDRIGKNAYRSIPTYSHDSRDLIPTSRTIERLKSPNNSTSCNVSRNNEFNALSLGANLMKVPKRSYDVYI